MVVCGSAHLCGSLWSEGSADLPEGCINRIIQLLDMCEGGLADMSPDFLMKLKLNSDAFLRKVFGNERCLTKGQLAQ